MSPFNAASKGKPKQVALPRDRELYWALRDWIYLIQAMQKCPTHVRELALCADLPEDIVYHDASNEGVGGAWIATNGLFTPTVFRMEWPDEVRREVITWDNPHGKLTNSDLETAGQLVSQLVREGLGPMRHRTTGALGDNTPTVARGRKWTSSCSQVAGRLLRALAMRRRVTQSGPFLTANIAGVDNELGNVPSCSWGRFPSLRCTCASDTTFLAHFNDMFPLPQGTSWRMYHLPSKLGMHGISELLMRPLPLDVWLRLPKKGQSSGSNGHGI